MFFTALLVEHTRDSYLQYSKNKLNKAYLHEKIQQEIMDVVEAKFILPEKEKCIRNFQGNGVI